METIEHNPAKFAVGDEALVAQKFPIGHYRVPMYMRGKKVRILRRLGKYINPETEAFGKNAGDKLWCYLVTITQIELWPAYQGKAIDKLEIEIFEPWLEPVKLSTNEQ
ncbi:MAG: SH3-like domain-containing protein [Chitinophagaceae bacterium]